MAKTKRDPGKPIKIEISLGELELVLDAARIGRWNVGDNVESLNYGDYNSEQLRVLDVACRKLQNLRDANHGTAPQNREGV